MSKKIVCPRCGGPIHASERHEKLRIASVEPETGVLLFFAEQSRYVDTTFQCADCKTVFYPAQHVFRMSKGGTVEWDTYEPPDDLPF